jgi:hypothetical protein
MKYYDTEEDFFKQTAKLLSIPEQILQNNVKFNAINAGNVKEFLRSGINDYTKLAHQVKDYFMEQIKHNQRVRIYSRGESKNTKYMPYAVQRFYGVVNEDRAPAGVGRVFIKIAVSGSRMLGEKATICSYSQFDAKLKALSRCVEFWCDEDDVENESKYKLKYLGFYSAENPAPGIFFAEPHQESIAIGYFLETATTGFYKNASFTVAKNYVSTIFSAEEGRRLGFDYSERFFPNNPDEFNIITGFLSHRGEAYSVGYVLYDRHINFHLYTQFQGRFNGSDPIPTKGLAVWHQDQDIALPIIKAYYGKFDKAGLADDSTGIEVDYALQCKYIGEFEEGKIRGIGMYLRNLSADRMAAPKSLDDIEGQKLHENHCSYPWIVAFAQFDGVNPLSPWLKLAFQNSCLKYAQMITTTAAPTEIRVEKPLAELLQAKLSNSVALLKLLVKRFSHHLNKLDLSDSNDAYLTVGNQQQKASAAFSTDSKPFQPSRSGTNIQATEIKQIFEIPTDEGTEAVLGELKFDPTSALQIIKLQQYAGEKRYIDAVSLCRLLKASFTSFKAEVAAEMECPNEKGLLIIGRRKLFVLTAEGLTKAMNWNKCEQRQEISSWLQGTVIPWLKDEISSNNNYPSFISTNANALSSTRMKRKSGVNVVAAPFSMLLGPAAQQGKRMRSSDQAKAETAEVGVQTDNLSTSVDGRYSYTETELRSENWQLKLDVQLLQQRLIQANQNSSTLYEMQRISSQQRMGDLTCAQI